MLPVTDLDYELPPNLIATHGVEPRDQARLLVTAPGRGVLSHSRFKDLPAYLRPGDLLVVNTTRVLPARLVGAREDTGAAVQGLYVADASERAADGSLLWRVLLKMRRFRAGARVIVFDAAGSDSGLRLKLISPAGAGPAGSTGESSGHDGWLVEVTDRGGLRPGDSTPVLLERVGRTPLPPYILAARRNQATGFDGASAQQPVPIEGGGGDAVDRAEYQTVYADPALAGSVAAPTAGLHFTDRLLDELKGKGVWVAPVVLHVGLGTFRPVETEFVEQHPMHAEWCRVPADTARVILQTRAAGGRVLAVGTTSARTLESFDFREETGRELVDLANLEKETRLLITPGFQFRTVDGMVTNFHLPRSTLMAMVAALLQTSESAGIEQLRVLYREAIAHRYRFYSLGDAMLILPGG
ncbi:MAG: tRNA preQ1(34) S-adenosylmethionine ribosyltransferase-isomerase QueA [Phycisphaerales bacterium]